MIPRIDHIGIAVESIEESRKLYEQLGLDWPDAFERATRTYLEAQLGLRIESPHPNS